MALDGTWRGDLERWLEPFLAVLLHPARRRICPIHVAGLIGPGERWSMQPLAMRAGEVGYDQLRHFVAAGVWDAEPLEAALLAEADRLVGGEDASLVVDGTALPEKGRHSVGVAAQHASVLGKNANCQTLVSLTLARREVPVMVCLKLFLPESWTRAGRATPSGSCGLGCPRSAGHRAPSRRLLLRRSIACWPPECASAASWRMRAMAGARHSAKP